MPNPIAFAQMMLKKNPNIANNAMKKNMVNILMNGDQQAGEQLANNILQTYGISKEDALKQAQSYFTNQ